MIHHDHELLKNVKKGDLLIVFNGNLNRICEVTHTTRLYIDAGGSRFRRRDGQVPGGGGVFSPVAHVPREGEVEEIRMRARVRKLRTDVHQLLNANINKLNTDQLNKIREIIEGCLQIMSSPGRLDADTIIRIAHAFHINSHTSRS